MLGAIRAQAPKASSHFPALWGCLEHVPSGLWSPIFLHPYCSTALTGFLILPQPPGVEPKSM